MKYEVVERDGLNGKRFTVCKIEEGWINRGWKYYVMVNSDGMESGWTEYSGEAFWGTKRQAQKLLKLVED